MFLRDALTCSETCQHNQDIVFGKIREGETAKALRMQEIKELNKNVLTIMITLKIDPKNDETFISGLKKIGS